MQRQRIEDEFSTKKTEECGSEQPLGGVPEDTLLELCDSAVRDDFVFKPYPST
jgi:hypothetical protein